MPIKTMTTVDGVEQGASQALIDAVRELFPRELRAAMALPEDPEATEALDRGKLEALAELGEDDKFGTATVRGDSLTGRWIVFSVITPRGDISRGCFKLDEFEELKKPPANKKRPKGSAVTSVNVQGDGGRL